MPLFRRQDGDLVPDVPPVRAVMPYLMTGRNESAVLHPERHLGDPGAGAPGLAGAAG